MDPEARQPASAWARYAQPEGIKRILALRDGLEADLLQKKQSFRDIVEKSRTWFDGKQPSFETVDGFAKYLDSAWDKQKEEVNAAFDKVKATVKETTPDSRNFAPTKEGLAEFNQANAVWKKSGQAVLETTTTWTGFFQEITDTILDLLAKLGQLLTQLATTVTEFAVRTVSELIHSFVTWLDRRIN